MEKAHSLERSGNTCKYLGTWPCRAAARRADEAGAQLCGLRDPAAPHAVLPVALGARLPFPPVWPHQHKVRATLQPHFHFPAGGRGVTAKAVPSSSGGKRAHAHLLQRPGLHPRLHSEGGTGWGWHWVVAASGVGASCTDTGQTPREGLEPPSPLSCSPRLQSKRERGLANWATMSVWASGRLRPDGSCAPTHHRCLGRLLSAPVDLVGRFLGDSPFCWGRGLWTIHIVARQPSL